MTPEQDKQLSVVLGQITGMLQEIAFRKRSLLPYAYLSTDATPLTIPDAVKSFNIINLGLNGDCVEFEPITVTGITGITSIPKTLRVFGYSIENDQNEIKGPIQVTGLNNHHILIQYLK